MNKQLRILLLEDSLDDVTLIEHLLKKEKINFTSRVVDARQEYREQLQEFLPDVVISDHSLPQFNSMEALQMFLEYKHDRNHSAAFVLVTGTVSEEFAVKAMKGGADDYILKDRLKRLPSAVLNSVEKNRMKEQKRKEEEEKLHLLDILQKSLHEIFVLDPETLKFQYVNQHGLENLGYELEEMLNMTPAETIYEFDEEGFRKALAKVEQSQKGKIYELSAVRKDKTSYPIQIHLEVILQGQKKVALANCLDITETKEHQQQKEIALFIQDCFSEDKDLETSLRLVLKDLCHRSSVPAAEIWGKDYGENLRCFGRWKEDGYPVPETGKIFAEKVLTSGTSEQCEDFSEKSFFPQGSVLEKKYEGAVAYPVKSGKEITAVIIFFVQKKIRKRDLFINLREGVQDKLAGNIKRKKTEQELQKIFEISPDILAILGKDGHFKKVNPALQRILGYKEDEWASLNFEDLLHPEDLELLQHWRVTKLKKGEVAQYECRWLSKNGNYRWFTWSVTPFLEDDLNLGIGKDITENKEQLEVIKERNKNLADIAWEQSHTVRAPLSRLMACIAYLEENEENQKEMIASIKNSAHELDSIVKRIVNKTEHVCENEEY